MVSSTSLKIDMLANRPLNTDPFINLVFAFTNNTAQQISELHFQLAVTKVSHRTPPCCLNVFTHGAWQGYELQLKPQSGRSLGPKQSRGVTQSINVWHTGDKARKVEAIKLRWRVSYKVGETLKQEMGEIPEFSVA